ncbi:MAG: FUSC family protein [Pedococcus sp.]
MESGARRDPGELWTGARSAVSGWSADAIQAGRMAGPQRDAALLMGKAALATVLAWQFAVLVLDSSNPFYAPMAALLVVDKTIVRSLGASGQRVLAVVVGMSAAWLVGTWVGVHWWTMLPVLYLALLLARWRRLGDHGIQVPTMVLLSLLTVGGTDMEFTYLTIVETVAGGLIGVLTNAIVLAPLHVQQPREQIRSLTSRVCALLNDIAAGLREGWDTDAARAWYDASTEIIALAPSIQEEIETGRESVRFNPRDNLRRLEVDWAGYAQTVEAVRRAQWQLSGIARTLVDAADEDESQPSPTKRFLNCYAEALDKIAGALSHLGLAGEDEMRAVTDYLASASDVLDQLGHEIRETELEDPRAWPAYGALLLDAQRLVRELEVASHKAVMPTDSGPIRKPARRVMGR